MENRNSVGVWPKCTADKCEAHLLDAPKAADEPPGDDGLHAKPREVACAGQNMATGLSASLWCPEMQGGESSDGMAAIPCLSHRYADEVSNFARAEHC